jgi:hypothetical protein
MAVPLRGKQYTGPTQISEIGIGILGLALLFRAPATCRVTGYGGCEMA